MNIIRRVLSGKSSKRYPLHVTQAPAPFFIVGSGRCGTTLLRRELSNAASVHIPPETFALSDAIRVFKESAADDWNDIVEQVLAKFDYHPEFGYFELPSLRELAEERKILDKLIGSELKIIIIHQCNREYICILFTFQNLSRSLAKLL